MEVLVRHVGSPAWEECSMSWMSGEEGVSRGIQYPTKCTALLASHWCLSCLYCEFHQSAQVCIALTHTHIYLSSCLSLKFTHMGNTLILSWVRMFPSACICSYIHPPPPTPTPPTLLPMKKMKWWFQAVQKRFLLHVDCRGTEVKLVVVCTYALVGQAFWIFMHIIGEKNGGPQTIPMFWS